MSRCRVVVTNLNGEYEPIFNHRLFSWLVFVNVIGTKNDPGVICPSCIYIAAGLVLSKLRNLSGALFKMSAHFRENTSQLARPTIISDMLKYTHHETNQKRLSIVGGQPAGGRTSWFVRMLDEPKKERLRKNSAA